MPPRRRVSVGRRGLPRDEVVSRGRESRGRHEHPWVYSVKTKSGRRSTETMVMSAYNKVDLLGQIIERGARESEDLFVWNVSKLLKSQVTSRRDR